jgi:hypothetical protein
VVDYLLHLLVNVACEYSLEYHQNDVLVPSTPAAMEDHDPYWLPSAQTVLVVHNVLCIDSQLLLES